MEVLEGLFPGFVLARRAGLRSNSGGTHQSAGTIYRAASSEHGAESVRVRYGGGLGVSLGFLRRIGEG